MSSSAACKNIYTQIVFYRSHRIRYQIKHLKICVTEQTSTAALNVMSTDTVTSLDFCVHCVGFTRGSEDGDGRRDTRMDEDETGTPGQWNWAGKAGERFCFEGTRDDDLGLKSKRNAGFYPSLKFLLHKCDVGSRATPVENIPLGKILDETKWVHTASARATMHHQCVFSEKPETKESKMGRFCLSEED